MKNYGIKEWFICVAGWVIVGIQIYWYATNQYEPDNLNIGALFVAVIFMFAPKNLVRIFLSAAEAVASKFFKITHKDPDQKDSD